MDKKKRTVKIIVLIVVCIFAECLISNYSALSIIFSGAEEVNVDFESPNVSSSGAIYINTGDKITLNDSNILISDLNCELKNICLVLSGDYYEYVHLDISYLDDNFAYEEDGYDYNTSYVLMYSGINEKNYFNVNSFGKVKSLKINVGDVDNNLTISEISLNKPPEFSFHFLRFAIILISVFVIAYGVWNFTLEDNDYLFMKLLTAVMCLVVFLGFMMLVNHQDVKFLDEYPSENYSGEDQYRQLFESFKKGQLNLDLDYDVSKLEALGNPYDRSERNAKDTTGNFWDRAYYNGNFYSYFGVAPVFTAYYPVNILTGKVPTIEFANTLLCIYAVIFISLLYIEMIKRFCKDVPLVLAVLGQIALLFGSAVFAAAFEFQFYYMAVISGVTWTAAFLYFLLKAYYESSFKKRIALLVLSGVSVVLIVASRPTLIFYGVAALVPAVFILASKEETLNRKITYVVSIGTPIAIGAVIIMIYNYKRFENPFEFGFNYQLTVSIAKANTFSLAMIPAAFYHYFIQQPNINTKFPYIELKAKTLDTYHRYNYTGRTMGIFNYPITWGFLLTPIICRRRDKFKTAFIITFAAAAVVMAYIDMCKAGSHYRYTVDILMPVILVSLVVIFDCLNILKGLSKKVYLISYVFTLIAMFTTIYVGYLLMFANEKHKLINDYSFVGHLLQNL